MWDKISKYLPLFSSAVITGVDEAGYPYSFRCRPEPDPAGIMRVDIPAGVSAYAGPAGMLCHSHDEKYWSLKAFYLRGKLEQSEQGWIFRPEKFVPGNGTASMLKTLGDASKTAKTYLQKRGLARPKVDWEGLTAIKKAVIASEKAKS